MNNHQKDYSLKDSGKRKDFETGAIREILTGKGRFDLIPWDVVRALAIHFEKGLAKYPERNWERGVPLNSYFDSALRHITQVISGKDDENHLIAAIFNLVCAYQTILWIQEGKLPEELYNMPNKITLPKLNSD